MKSWFASFMHQDRVRAVMKSALIFFLHKLPGIFAFFVPVWQAAIHILEICHKHSGV